MDSLGAWEKWKAEMQATIESYQETDIDAKHSLLRLKGLVNDTRELLKQPDNQWAQWALKEVSAKIDREIKLINKLLENINNKNDDYKSVINIKNKVRQGFYSYLQAYLELQQLLKDKNFERCYKAEIFGEDGEELFVEAEQTIAEAVFAYPLEG